MRGLLALVVLTLVLSGCSGGDGRPSAESVAERAIDRLEEDQGPDGDISGAIFSVELDIDDDVSVEVDATASIEMFQDDAGLIEMRFDEVRLDGARWSELEAFELELYCYQERLVLKVTGHQDWGGNDVDIETANDAEACFGDDVDEDAMATSIQRLADEVGDGVAGGFLSTFLEPTPDEEYELVEAAWAGDEVRAQFEVHDDEGTHDEFVVIQDGRIVTQTMESDEDGVETEIEMTYEYGPRSSPPDVRGAEQV